MAQTGRVVSIWRYPVKSMAGERIPTGSLGPLGLHADRTWAVRDVELDATTSAKRLPSLMWCTARYAAEPPADAGPGRAPEVIIGFPDGLEVCSSDPSVHQTLSAYLDRDVELRALPSVSDKGAYRGPIATKSDIRTIFGLAPDDPLPDLSMFPVRKLAEISRYATPVGTYVDAYPLHLLTEQSLRAMASHSPDADFDVRRFRPTILVDWPAGGEQPELGWCGGILSAGTARLAPQIPTVRCVMPSHSQPGLDRDPAVTRTVAAHARRCLGVYATVAASGRITEGDVLQLDPPAKSLSPDSVAAMVKRAAMKAFAAVLPRGG